MSLPSNAAGSSPLYQLFLIACGFFGQSAGLTRPAVPQIPHCLLRPAVSRKHTLFIALYALTILRGRKIRKVPHMFAADIRLRVKQLTVYPDKFLLVLLAEQIPP